MQRILKKMVVDAFPNDVYKMLEIVSSSHKDSFTLPMSSKGRNKKITASIIITPISKQRFIFYKQKLSKAEKEAFEIVREGAIRFDVLPVGIVKLSPIEDELTLMQKTNLLFVDHVNYPDFEEEELLEKIIYLFIERVENFFQKIGLLVNAPAQEKHRETNQPDKPPRLVSGKRLNEWKSIWRIVKNAYRGGGRSYADLVKLLPKQPTNTKRKQPSPRLMADIIKAAEFYKWE